MGDNHITIYTRIDECLGRYGSLRIDKYSGAVLMHDGVREAAPWSSGLSYVSALARLERSLRGETQTYNTRKPNSSIDHWLREGNRLSSERDGTRGWDRMMLDVVDRFQAPVFAVPGESFSQALATLEETMNPDIVSAMIDGGSLVEYLFEHPSASFLVPDSELGWRELG